jgi:hypothetical protein
MLVPGANIPILRARSREAFIDLPLIAVITSPVAMPALSARL